MRRAARERRSKLTWTVTPANTASERRFSRSAAEASNATLKSRFRFRPNRYVAEFNKTPHCHVVSRLLLQHRPFAAMLASPTISKTQLSN